MRSLGRFDDFPPLEGVVGIRFLKSLLFALDRFLLCRRGFFEESDFLTLVFSLLSETSPKGDGLVSIVFVMFRLTGKDFVLCLFLCLIGNLFRFSLTLSHCFHRFLQN